ncbi:PssE/Cps14G family polysaccharide biosynthesis glycosyltransferase [Thalassotalea hakodatensis]|uniref:PssE/Cps14G family polysaccharide biosynthesis glycosyltransferase n=1 Tax=Thalassotalea hakodatensis TaxID=3030492 RepID=UPI0025747C7E|nr:PssE/Cps14G family polysaccharide biosynthesis glycosyltransferase [Thalassotalea hakodatensis]
MNIFVTLGTTPFPELLAEVNKLQNQTADNFVIQSVSGDLTRFNESFSYTNDIQYWYQWADIIITHAGAGSTYNLLELNKKLVLVPNTFRKDKHQLELAKYIESKNYAVVCYQLKKLQQCITKVKDYSIKKYQKVQFSGIEDIKALFQI